MFFFENVNNSLGKLAFVTQSNLVLLKPIWSIDHDAGMGNFGMGWNAVPQILCGLGTVGCTSGKAAH